MNDTLKTIHNLRSTHGNFSERDVSDEDMKTIINACVRAANASARQTYSIIVINDRKVVREQFVYAGSKALLFCVDYNRLIDAAKYLDQEFNEQDGILSFITGSTDSILAAQTAAIAARSLGIDSLFTNSIYRRDINSLYDAFNIPKNNCFPLIALVLGYADTEPPYLKGRINGKGVIHYGEYQRLNESELNELISLYDDSEKHIAMNNEWRENGFKHYLDWFYTVWTGGRGIEKEKEIYSILERAKFIEKGLINEIHQG